MKTNLLGLAIKIASEAFLTKTDKAGKPYILHCLRVMHKLHSNDEELNCIAVLHDLIEDCPEWNYTKLADLGFPLRVLSALQLLTHKKSTPYDVYIANIATNKDATLVKLADLRDNSNITRLKGVTQKDLERMEKYHKAYLFLTKKQN